jgi:hypothetical protein
MSARPVFGIVFAAVFALAYLVCIQKNLALFTYHPAPNEWAWGVEKAREGGPAMYWYGWLASAGLLATLAGLVAQRLPLGLTQRLPPALAWAVPLAVMLVFGYLLRNFFLR